MIPHMHRFRPLKIPKNAHPLVRALFEEMNRQRCTAKDLCRKAGLNPATLVAWRSTNSPQLLNMEAAWNVLGFTLRPTMMKEQYDVREEAVQPAKQAAKSAASELDEYALRVAAIQSPAREMAEAD